MQKRAYTNLMAISGKKPVIDMQKIKRKESKHIIKESHQTTREDSKRRTAKTTVKQVTKWQYVHTYQ